MAGLWLLAVAALGYVLYRISDILLVAFIAALIAVYLSSLTDILCRRLRVPRGVGLALSALASIGGLAGVAALLVPAVASQVQDLVAAIPQYVASLDRWVGRLAMDYQFLHDTGIASSENGLVTRAISDAIEFARRGVFDYATVTGKVVIDGAAVVVMAIYMARNPAVYRDGIVQITPPRHRAVTLGILNDLGATLRAWVGAQLLAMVVLAVLTGVGLWLLSVPYWLAFAIFTGVAVLVPFFGSIVSTLVPALLVLPDRGPLVFFAVAMVGVVVHVVEANIVHPLIMQHRVALPPVLTILSVLVMGALGGLLGLLVSVPALATVVVVVRHLLIYQTYGERPTDAVPPPAVLQPAKRDSASQVQPAAG